MSYTPPGVICAQITSFFQLHHVMFNHADLHVQHALSSILTLCAKISPRPDLALNAAFAVAGLLILLTTFAARSIQPSFH
jgi:hypothetical protein